MNKARGGVSLVESLVTLVLLLVTVVAVYKALSVRQDIYGAARSTVQEEEEVRAALAVLETELREVAPRGDAIGGSDLAVVERDSVVFRAHRQLGFVCGHPDPDRLRVAVEGEPLQTGDSVWVFVEGDPDRWQDDAWVPAYVRAARPADRGACGAAIPASEAQALELSADHSLEGVAPLSPVRGFEWVTYTLRDRGLDGWSLVRSAGASGRQTVLAERLAPPGTGLAFEYFDAGGAVTSDAAHVTHMRVEVERAAGSAGAEPARFLTDLHLRND